MKQYLEIIKQLTIKIEELELLNEKLQTEVDGLEKSIEEIYE